MPTTGSCLFVSARAFRVSADAGSSPARSLLPTASSAGWWRSKHTAAALAFSRLREKGLATTIPLSTAVAIHLLMPVSSPRWLRGWCGMCPSVPPQPLCACSHYPCSLPVRCLRWACSPTIGFVTLWMLANPFFGFVGYVLLFGLAPAHA